MRLRPGVSVLWRGPTEVQLGTDPRWAVVLTDLSPGAALALRAVGPAAQDHEILVALQREQVARAEVDAILGHLRAAHLLVPGTGRIDSPDVSAWSLVGPCGHGDAVVARRARQSVRVVGLGRLGGSLATQLASAGIGAVELEDGGRVTPADVGVGGLSTRDVGALRTSATARLVHDCAPSVRTTPRRNGTPDLVVLVEPDVADPVRYRDLLDADIPHLSVVVREASVLVGPLVHPGRSACLRCVDLHRADRDPGWPVVASQLAGRAGQRSVETTLAAMGSALATAQVLAHLAGRPTAVRDASLEICLPDALPRRTSWPMHHGCDCTGPPRTSTDPSGASADTNGPGTRTVPGPPTVA